MQGALPRAGCRRFAVRAACGARHPETRPPRRRRPWLLLAWRPNGFRGSCCHIGSSSPTRPSTSLGGATHAQRADCSRCGEMSSPGHPNVRGDRRCGSTSGLGAVGAAWSRDRDRGSRGRSGRGGRGTRHGRRGGPCRSGRSGRGRRHRCRQRSGRRSRGRSSRGRKEQQRVDVAVRVLGAPDAQVKVWDVVLDLAAGPDRADSHPFDDRVAALNAHRTEMRQRHRVAVGGLDRHGSATHRHGAGKRDRP